MNHWTPAEISELERLAVDGLSAREIASRIGRTRNAVSGRADRDGLTLGRRGRAPARPQHKAPEPRGCRWIDGDPAVPGWQWCDVPQTKQRGKLQPYCATHYRRAWERR